MPNFLEFLRQQNIFGPRPSGSVMNQGPMLNLPPGPNTPASMFNIGDNPNAMFQPPPSFDASSDYLANLNQPTFGSTDMSKPFQVEQPPLFDMDAGQRMGELYKPQTEATDRFNQLVQNYPQAKDPSWLRRIGAMVVDYTKGGRAGQEFFERPRTNAIEDWKNKIQPAQQAANLERYENVNQRTLAANQIAAELREKAQQAKERNDEVNAKIRQQRADIYQFKATHPNWKIMFPKGGNIIAINPITQETYDTGIPTGSATDLDKIWLMDEQKLEQIAATGEQTRETETTRQAGRMAVTKERGEQARETRATVPGGITGQGGSPTQIKVGQYNKARQIKNSSPILSKFVELGTGNEFKIKKPNERGGPTPQQYSDIINAIYGSTTQSGGKSSMSGPGPRQPLTSPPPAPAGWKYIPKQGGGWTPVEDK